MKRMSQKEAAPFSGPSAPQTYGTGLSIHAFAHGALATWTVASAGK